MPPAARVADLHTCSLTTGSVPHVGGPILPPGEPSVMIGFQPAARSSDLAACSGPPDMIQDGSRSVLIGGMPAARFGDKTAHQGTIMAGCSTVLIGDMAGGGGSAGAGAGGAGSGSSGGAGSAGASPGAGPSAFHGSSRPRGPLTSSEVARQRRVLRDAARDGTPFAELCAPRSVASDDHDPEGGDRSEDASNHGSDDGSRGGSEG